MSSAAARFNEGFLSESYQDASTVSMELDKGKYSYCCLLLFLIEKYF